jgi:GTP cyclohydrolase I
MTEIMQLLNLDLSDDSLMETPHRIAKMYVDEISISCTGARIGVSSPRATSAS